MANPLPPLGYETPSKTDWSDTTFQEGVYVTGDFDELGNPLTTADPALALRDPLTGTPVQAADVLGDQHVAATDNDHAAHLNALARELGNDPQNPPRGIRTNVDGTVMVDVNDDPLTWGSVAERLTAERADLVARIDTVQTAIDDVAAGASAVGMAVVAEINGTYAARPAVADVPNAIWLGVSDATVHADFEQWDPVTGVGDTWQAIPAP